MKKITIISNTTGTAETMKLHLLEYFSDCLQIDCILLSQDFKFDVKATDLILTSGNYINIENQLIENNLTGFPTIKAERFIDYKKIAELSLIPDYTDILLVNDSESTAIETASQLKSIGFDRFNYELYYPGKISYNMHDIVITPGETGFVPYSPKKIIDIGSRKISIGTLFEIIKRLDLPLEKNRYIMNDFLRDIVKLSHDLLNEQTKTKLLNDSLIQVVEKIDYGVASIDNNFKITFCNNKFAYYLGKKKTDILNRDIRKILYPDSLPDNCSNQLKLILPIGTTIIKKDYVLDNNGFILTIKAISRNNGNTTRKLYNFQDYITKDDKELAMLNNAKKFSRSEACILIQGESGTGKEILAQAIHSNSVRCNMPFIPINITTISDNLIESELFGYEKGSFTGGLKEGKKGIFELANGGTIFIDEIGDAPYNIQVQLLRVLEENTIRKVGSHEEIPINVRIIAATNKNLVEETKKGNFRLDLFFRLNILPLNTTPLRCKKDDIKVLIEYYLSRKFKDMKIEDYFELETIDFLLNYQWPGNIRELSNLMNYLLIVDLNWKVRIQDLQTHMLNNYKSNESYCRDLTENEVLVLKLYNEEMKILGRIKAARLLKEQKINITEGMLKTLLAKLCSKDLLYYKKNKGYVITNKGKNSI